MKTALSISKHRMKSLTNDVSLLALSHSGCKIRDEILHEFFQRCHDIYKPTASLSDSCGIQLGVKNDLLAFLEELRQHKSKAPPASCIVLNGLVIVQMLKPAI